MQIYADMDRIDRIESDMANGLKPGYEQVSEWMETLGDERLYELARRIRMRRDGRRIDMCSIMNARSGRCSEDCKWCAQSKFHKTDIEVYPLVGEQEAVREAAHNASKGVRRFSLVTSGRALSDGETDRVCGIYRRIGSEVDISLCAWAVVERAARPAAAERRQALSLQFGDGPFVFRRALHDAYAAAETADDRMGPRGGAGNLLRGYHRHGRERAAAHRVRVGDPRHGSRVRADERAQSDSRHEA